MIYFNYYFQFLDSDGNKYKLRREQLTGVSVLYKKHSSVDSFTESTDFNIDEETDSLWVRLPSSSGLGDEQTDLVITLNAEPLRTLTTGLITVTLTEYTTGYIVTATPVPLYSQQGYSPRVIDGYWWQYDDAMQTFVNTGIKATGTVITEGEVVDYAENGNMNPITSNAVYDLNVNIENNLNVLNNNVTNLNSQVSQLQNKNYSVTINDETFTADQTGNINLGEIKAGLDTDNARMLSTETVIGGTTYPKGTFVVTEDGEDRVLATDANSIYDVVLENETGKSEWNLIFSASSSCKFDLRHTIFTTSKQGSCWFSRSGYDGRVICTSQELLSTFKYRVYLGNLYVYCKGAIPPAYVPRVRVITPDNISFHKSQQSLSFDESTLRDFEVFLTTDTKDWVVIEGGTFSIDPDDLTVTNYIVSQDVSYTFTESLNTPLSLTFKATADSTITVTDGTFTATSDEIEGGEIATLIFQDATHYEWNYAKADPETITAIKVNDETYYPSAGVIDLGEIGGEGTVKSVNDVLPDENGNVEIETYTLEVVGGGEGTVKSVNDVLPDDEGNVEIETGIKSNTISNLESFTNTMKFPDTRCWGLTTKPEGSYNYVDYPILYMQGSNKIVIMGKEVEFGTGTVKSVNDIEPDYTGNVEIETYSLEVQGGVKSVNNVLPDNNGNISLTIPTDCVTGIQTDSTMYRNPLDNGYVQLPKLKVKINGTEKEFVTKTGQSYPTDVCDLGNITATGSYVTEMSVTNETTVGSNANFYKPYISYKVDGITEAQKSEMTFRFVSKKSTKTASAALSALSSGDVADAELVKQYVIEEKQLTNMSNSASTSIYNLNDNTHYSFIQITDISEGVNVDTANCTYPHCFKFAYGNQYSKTPIKVMVAGTQVNDFDGNPLYMNNHDVIEVYTQVKYSTVWVTIVKEGKVVYQNFE